MPMISPLSSISPLGTREDNWSSYWATLISATVEDATPTHVALTFPFAQPSLGATDFTIAGFTINSASWTGPVLTLVLSAAVIYGDSLTIAFVKTGNTHVITNNVIIVWDGTVGDSFDGGTGSQSNPYLISSGEALAYLASRVNAGTNQSGIYFKQTNHINLASIPWTPIGIASPNYFSGLYDGDGKKLFNLNVDRNANYAGLFGYIYAGSKVAMLGIESGLVKGLNYTGGIVGYCYGGTIEYCYNKATVSPYTGIPQFQGGIAGSIQNSFSRVHDNYNLGQLTSIGWNVGGISGTVGGGIVLNNYSAALVTTTAAKAHGSLFGNIAGGTVGYNYYDSTISALGGSNYADVANQAEGKSTALMSSKVTYDHWDFSVWEMNGYPSLIIFDDSANYVVGDGLLIQSGASVDTFLAAKLNAGLTYKTAVRGSRSHRLLVGRKFFAVSGADSYSEEPMFVSPLLNKYNFSYTHYIQMPPADDNPLTACIEDNTDYSKRTLRRLFNSACYLGNHNAHHWFWLLLYPLMDGVNHPSNDDFRVARADGTNEFGYNVTTDTPRTAYGDVICSANYLNIVAFLDVTFANLSDAQCTEIRKKLSFFMAKDYRYNQDMLKVYDFLSNRYCGTSGYSVVDGDYTTRTPNTVGGVYPSAENRIIGGIFQGSSTLQNHEVWERIFVIYNYWSLEIWGRNHPIKFGTSSGGTFAGMFFRPVNNPNILRCYHDKAYSKFANGFSEFTSSITGQSRGIMQVMEALGYNDTMGAEFGYGYSGYDGQQRKESQWMYKLNSGVSKINYVGDGYSRALRMFDYELGDTPASLATLLASANIMLDKYDLTKADLESTFLTAQNNFAQIIEEIDKEIAYGLIPMALDDYGVGATNMSTRRICCALTLELVMQYCKARGIEMISRQEAAEIVFNTIPKGENIFPNHLLETGVKDVIGSANAPLYPDGWSSGEMVMDGSIRTLEVTEKAWIRSYLIQNGMATLSTIVKGEGTINIYLIRNKHPYWINEFQEATICAYELVGTISVNSIEYLEREINFELPLEPLKQYTTEPDAYTNYMKGLDDRICGLHIEVVPTTTITIKSPSLIVS